MSEVAPLISDLAIILIIAGIVTVIFKWLKQPVILGYIVAGIMAGPSVSLVPTVSDPANIKIWADIGVIFLLFAMGLDFSFKKLINVGITAIVATVTIVCGMMFTISRCPSSSVPISVSSPLSCAYGIVNRWLR